LGAFETYALLIVYFKWCRHVINNGEFFLVIFEINSGSSGFAVSVIWGAGLCVHGIRVPEVRKNTSLFTLLFGSLGVKAFRVVILVVGNFVYLSRIVGSVEFVAGIHRHIVC